MSGMADFDRVAADVRNWGRWGDADEIGTLNLITDEKVREAASLVRAGKVFPLGIAFGADGPMGMFKFRTNPIHLMTIDGGDASAFAEYARKWTGNPTAQALAGIFDASRFRFNDD
ncbi:MAG TPA: cyclase family protein, partial [Acidimicrobiia bacterium]|nr:cyclase family protein [Acidimicrobiia bacterium]